MRECDQCHELFDKGTFIGSGINWYCYQCFNRYIVGIPMKDEQEHKSKPARVVGTNPLLSCAMLPGEDLKAKDVQEGGTHYKDMPIQPFEYIYRNGIGYAEGNVIKYVSRWQYKNGIEDLKKARHYLDLMIDAEAGN